MRNMAWIGRIGCIAGAALWTVAGGVAAEDAAAPASQAPQQVEAAVGPSIQDNMDVSLEYVLTSEGITVDSTDGKEPFHYVHGRSQIIPGLEKQLAGLRIGDSKEVTVSPEDGYGQVDPEAFVEIPKEQLPKDVVPAEGMMLRGMSPEGKNFRAIIKAIKDNTVVLDLNHPLAGKTLNFKVTINEIKPKG